MCVCVCVCVVCVCVNEWQVWTLHATSGPLHCYVPISQNVCTRERVCVCACVYESVPPFLLFASALSLCYVCVKEGLHFLVQRSQGWSQTLKPSIEHRHFPRVLQWAPTQACAITPSLVSDVCIRRLLSLFVCFVLLSFSLFLPYFMPFCIQREVLSSNILPSHYTFLKNSHNGHMTCPCWALKLSTVITAQVWNMVAILVQPLHHLGSMLCDALNFSWRTKGIQQNHFHL